MSDEAVIVLYHYKVLFFLTDVKHILYHYKVRIVTLGSSALLL
jgi:hypothetical protein